jgi:hypothetical protein
LFHADKVLSVGPAFEILVPDDAPFVAITSSRLTFLYDYVGSVRRESTNDWILVTGPGPHIELNRWVFLEDAV